jgi:SAM-dependent methyltransferase
MDMRVFGIDVSDEQIAMAETAAQRESLDVDFSVAGAEALPFGESSMEVVTANQCWIYFDLDRTIPEVCRVLAPDGVLVVSHFSFLPRLDPIVAASEALVLKHNPDWAGADWDGYLPAEPRWSRASLSLTGFFTYDEAIPFTRESWRGRMRALRGIAASLTPEQVAQFDQEHNAMLEDMADETFTILHRIHAQIFTTKSS